MVSLLVDTVSTKKENLNEERIWLADVLEALVLFDAVPDWEGYRQYVNPHDHRVANCFSCHWRSVRNGGCVAPILCEASLQGMEVWEAVYHCSRYEESGRDQVSERNAEDRTGRRVLDAVASKSKELCVRVVRKTALFLFLTIIEWVI